MGSDRGQPDHASDRSPTGLTVAVDPQALNAYLSTFGPTGPYLTGPTSYSPTVTASSDFYDSLPAPTSNSGRKKKKKDVGGILGTGGDLLNGVLYALSLPGAAVRSAIKEAGDWKTPLNPDPYEGQSPSFRDFLVQTFDKDKQIWGADLVAGNPEKGITRGLFTDKVREDMNPLLKIVTGLAVDIGTDPLTALGGAGVAREGAEAVAEVAARNATKRIAEAASKYVDDVDELAPQLAKFYDEFGGVVETLGDQQIPQALATAKKIERIDEYSPIIGKAVEMARKAGDESVLDELTRGAEAVSRARRFGISGLRPEEAAIYLLDETGRQVGFRGLAFKAPFNRSESVGLRVPGTDSPLMLKVGETVGKARNAAVLAANKDQRLIGRLFNADRDLTVAARSDDPMVGFGAVLSKMYRDTARAKAADLIQRNTVRYASIMDGASDDVKQLVRWMGESGEDLAAGEELARLLPTLGSASMTLDDLQRAGLTQIPGGFPPWVVKTVSLEDIADAAGRARQLRTLLDDVAKKLQQAGANIHRIEDYLPRQLSEEARKMLAENGLLGRGQKSAPFAQFETARKLVDAKGDDVYEFMGERFVAKNNAEVTSAVSEIFRRKLSKVADANTVSEMEGFFSTDLDKVMASYLASAGRRIGQMNMATRLYNAGLGSADPAAFDDLVRSLGRDFEDIGRQHERLTERLLRAEDARANAKTQAGIDYHQGRIDDIEAKLSDLADRLDETVMARRSGLSREQKLDLELWKMDRADAKAGRSIRRSDIALEQRYVDGYVADAGTLVEKFGPQITPAQEALRRTFQEAEAAGDSETMLYVEGGLKSSEEVLRFASKIDGLVPEREQLIAQANELIAEAQRVNPFFEDLFNESYIGGRQVTKQNPYGIPDSVEIPSFDEELADIHSQLVDLDATMRGYGQDLFRHQQLVREAQSNMRPEITPDEFLDFVKDNMVPIARQTIDQAMRTIRYGIDTPAEAAELLLAVNRMTDPEAIAGILKSLDKGIAFVKRFQIMTPGFQSRNAIGATWQNAALAQVKWSTWGEYERLWRASRNETLTAAEARLWKMVTRAHGRGMIGKEGRRGTDLLREMGANIKPANKLQRLNLFSKDFAGVYAGQRVGESIEETMRGVLALDTLLSGGTLDSAVRRVNKFHFNYSSDALTPFEQGLRRFMPFYTWSRYNLPLQIEMLGRQPQAYSRIAELRAEIESTSEPDQLIPAYFAKLGPAIRLPFTASGGGRLYLTPDLPMRDLGRIPTAGNPFSAVVNEVASMVTPVVKAPLEIRMGKQFFNDIPLRDDRAVPLPEPFVRMPALVPAMRLLWGNRIQEGPDGKVYTSERNAYLITQYMPVLGVVRRLTSSEEKYQERRLASIMSYLGLGMRTNTLEEQRRLMRGEQIRESNSNQASRRFTQSVRRGGG